MPEYKFELNGSFTFEEAKHTLEQLKNIPGHSDSSAYERMKEAGWHYSMDGYYAEQQRLANALSFKGSIVVRVDPGPIPPVNPPPPPAPKPEPTPDDE